MATPRLTRSDPHDAAATGDVATLERFFAQPETLAAALAVEARVTDDAILTINPRNAYEPPPHSAWVYRCGRRVGTHIFRVALTKRQYDVIEWLFTSRVSTVLRRTLQFLFMDTVKCAIARSDHQVLELLLTSHVWTRFPARASPRFMSALVREAVERRQVVAMNMLAAHGADFDRVLDNHEGLRYKATETKPTPLFNVLRDHGAFTIGDDRVLHYAASCIRGEAILTLLELGVDPHSPVRTLLHYAADEGDHEGVAALLENVCVDMDAQIFEGDTPLCAAVDTLRMMRFDGSEAGPDDRERPVLDTIELHLRHGADPNICENDGHPTHAPLHAALAMASVEAVRLLLAWGADPNFRTIYGRQTPAHVLARRGVFSSTTLSMLVLLVAHGADLTLSNADGETALQLLPPTVQEAFRITGPISRPMKRRKYG